MAITNINPKKIKPEAHKKPTVLLTPEQRALIANLDANAYQNGMKGIQERQAKLMHK